jgi:mRNA interferase RelE/StbE
LTIHLTQSAPADLEATPDRLRDQVVQAIKSLAEKPPPVGATIKRLKGFKPPLYRLRSGDYHVLFRVQGSTILVMKIIDEEDLERTIKRLGEH